MEFVEYFYDDFKTNLSLIIAAILIVLVMCAAGKLKKEALTHVFFAILIVAGPPAIINYNQYAQFNNSDKIKKNIKIKDLDYVAQTFQSQKYTTDALKHVGGYVLRDESLKKFILDDSFKDKLITNYEKELLSSIKETDKRIGLSNKAYITEQENKIGVGDICEITYVKTNRYNIILDIEKIENDT